MALFQILRHTTYKYLFSQSQRAATVRHYGSRYTIISIQEKSDTNAVKRHYNVQLWIVRMVVEQAFGLLKGRFKCLMPTILFRRSHLQVLQIYLFQFTSKYFNLPINFGIFSISTIIKYIGVVPQLSSAKMNHRGTSCTHYHDWLGYHEL